MPTQKEIGEHLDLSQAEVSKLCDELNIDWRNEQMSTVRVAYIRKLRAVAAGHRSSDGLDLTHERVLTERVDRELKALTLAEKRLQLVNVEQLEPELVQMVASFRAELLSRDDKLKADLDALYGIDVDIQVLTAHTHDALSQLARYDAQRARADASPDSEDGAAGEAEHDGMVQAAAPAQRESLGQAGPVQP